MSSEQRVDGGHDKDVKPIDPAVLPAPALAIVHNDPVPEKALQYDCRLRPGEQQSVLVAAQREWSAGVWYQARRLSFFGWQPAGTIIKVIDRAQPITATFQIGRSVTQSECSVVYHDGCATFRRPVLHENGGPDLVLTTTLNWVSSAHAPFQLYQIEFPRRKGPDTMLPPNMFVGDAPAGLSRPYGFAERAQLRLEDRAPAFLGVLERWWSVRRVNTDIMWGQASAVDQPVVRVVNVRSTGSQDRLEVRFFASGSVHIVRYERGELRFAEIRANGTESFFAVTSNWHDNDQSNNCQPFRLRIAP